MRELPGAYELWLICLSRGIAVLTVTYQDPASVASPEEAVRLALAPSVPNPFPSSTVLRFELPRADHARLAVYDVHGRLVRSLLDGPTPAGATQVPWDALDDHGRPVAGGIYFWKLNASGEEAVSRSVLVR